MLVLGVRVKEAKTLNPDPEIENGPWEGSGAAGGRL